METKISSLEFENSEYEKVICDVKREQEKVCNIKTISTVFRIY